VSNTKRPYTGFDSIGTTVPPGVQKFMDCLHHRWGLNNIGILAVRAMRSAPAQYQNKNKAQLEALPDYKKWMSVHATGRAIDTGYSNRATALEAWDWCLMYATELGIEELHDYAYDPDGKGSLKAWGRGYRCSRADVSGGIKIYTEQDNAGTPGGQWLHWEIAPAFAQSAEKMATAWKALPRPSVITKT